MLISPGVRSRAFYVLLITEVDIILLHSPIGIDLLTSNKPSCTKQTSE